MLIIDLLGDEETIVICDDVSRVSDDERKKLELEFVKRQIAERAPIVIPVEFDNQG